MDIALLAAIITALATIFAAWIMIRRKATRMRTGNTRILSQMQELLFEVRRHNAKIKHLLANEPGPDFASEIVDSAISYRNSCDKLQDFVGSHRAFVGRKFYESVAELISAASELIDSLNRGMSGTVPSDQVARELTERGNHFQRILRSAEDALAKEVQRH
ncbi:MAG: hypothetical protein V3W14_08790 [Candidatus Neomarinimicrobiota bacterium]